MKHKIKVYRCRTMELWYVKCSCGGPVEVTPAPSVSNGETYFGRDTWDAAFAIGVAHQQLNSERGR